jgi:hypothetical protein
VCFVTAVWKNCNVGHFGNGSKFTEKKILVCTRTPEENTTKYVRCVRRVAIKRYVVSACRFGGPRETARLSADGIL